MNAADTAWRRPPRPPRPRFLASSILPALTIFLTAILRCTSSTRTNIPAQFLSSAAECAISHGTPALPLLSQSAPKPPLMAGARLPCRRRLPRLVARPAPSAPARWPRAASAETAAQLLGGRSEWVQAPRHRHPTARCPNGPPTANRPLTVCTMHLQSSPPSPL